MGALGVVSGGVQRHGRAPLPGVVETVLSSGDAREVGVAQQDHEAAEETESRTDPAGVQREPERHQTLISVDPHRKPDRRYDAAHRWKRRAHTGITKKQNSEELSLCAAAASSVPEAGDRKDPSLPTGSRPV